MADRIEARDSEAKEWVDRRSEAWHKGYDMGESFLANRVTIIPDAPTEPNARYLFYFYLQGVAQAVANRARDVGGINFGRTQEDPQNHNRKESNGGT